MIDILAVLVLCSGAIPEGQEEAEAWCLHNEPQEAPQSREEKHLPGIKQQPLAGWLAGSENLSVRPDGKITHHPC